LLLHVGVPRLGELLLELLPGDLLLLRIKLLVKLLRLLEPIPKNPHCQLPAFPLDHLPGSLGIRVIGSRCADAGLPCSRGG
jgi:hypothetical protein